jgi:DNA-binding NarL/FixJ family response regulator
VWHSCALSHTGQRKVSRVLEEFGVPAVTEQVYRSVLQHPGTGAEEFAAMLEDEVQVVRDALAELRELGLVEATPSGAWLALSPDAALELLIAREEELLEKRRARLAAGRQAIPELVQDYVTHRRTYVADQVELLTDGALVRARLYQLTTEASVSAWAISPGDALRPEAIAAALPLDQQLGSRGVDARMVVSTSSLGPPIWMDYLETLGRLRHQVRASATATQRCIIVDGRYAVIPSSDARSPGAYVLRGQSLVAPLVALFEEVWAGAEPVVADRADELVGPVTEARMRQVAALLARGIKDDALARRLNVSVRTVRRLVSATMDELRADSRFQAGVLAVRRGWVDPGESD